MKKFTTQFKNKNSNKLNFKQMKTKIQIMVVCLLSLVFVLSCNKYDDDDVYPEDALQSQKIAQDDPENQVMSTTYYVTPSVGNYTNPGSPSITLPGRMVYGEECGSALGGIIRAKIKSSTGSSIVVEVSKQDGTAFTTKGTISLQAGSICGGATSSTSVSGVGSQTTFDLPISYFGFTQGVKHYYAVFETEAGVRYYAEPFMVYTLPTYTMSSIDGNIMGTVNGIPVKSSGIGSSGKINQNASSINQCTKFCNDYYATVYGMNIRHSGTEGGHAKTWFGNAILKGLDSFSNGGSTPPRIGDILCFDNNPSSSTKNGHVGIITEVSDTEVKIAHQNGGTSWAPIGGLVNRSGNTLTVSGFTVQGWLRKP